MVISDIPLYTLWVLLKLSHCYDCLADQIFNVTIHGELCIPVNLCQQHHTSRIILGNAQERNHLIWRDLEMRQNVNLTYNNRTDTFHFCFNNVTKSFLFLEYCDVSRVQPCESGSTFCCSNWATFVSKTRVNVAGDRCKWLYNPTQLLMKT